jgi:hypothetical protein
MTPELLSQQINTSWTLAAAFLVFFMQAGFGEHALPCYPEFVMVSDKVSAPAAERAHGKVRVGKLEPVLQEVES